jgi:hypothetical protein
LLGKRQQDGRAEIQIPYRFDPPPASEAESDPSTSVLKNGRPSITPDTNTPTLTVVAVRCPTQDRVQHPLAENLKLVTVPAASVQGNCHCLCSWTLPCNSASGTIAIADKAGPRSPTSFTTVYIDSAPQDAVLTLMRSTGAVGCSWQHRTGAMHDPASRVRRILLMSTSSTELPLIGFLRSSP